MDEETEVLDGGFLANKPNSVTESESGFQSLVNTAFHCTVPYKFGGSKNMLQQ